MQPKTLQFVTKLIALSYSKVHGAVLQMLAVLGAGRMHCLPNTPPVHLP